MARALATATRGKQVPAAIKLSYFAGVMDSDGCFAISKMKAGIQRNKNPRYVFTMIVTNTNETMMKWLVRNFGGTYWGRRMLSEKHKQTYNWRFSNGRAIWILEAVRPYLVAKRAQCALAIELLSKWKTNHGMGARTSDKEVARREACYLKMKWLNKTGPVQPQRLNSLAPVQQGDAIV